MQEFVSPSVFSLKKRQPTRQATIQGRPEGKENEIIDYVDAKLEIWFEKIMMKDREREKREREQELEWQAREKERQSERERGRVHSK